MPLSIIFDAVPGFRTEPNVNYEPRLGLFRAQVTFPHPILYGVYCSTAFALAWYTPLARGAGRFVRYFWCTIVFLATFFSVSSGAILSVMLQLMLMGWDWVTKKLKRRWLILFLIIAFCYVVIDLLSNRTPVTIFISLATFSAHNAWYRIIIWDYGSAEVLRNPLFGIGLREWIRPSWMQSTSVDNFWLLTAMRYGFPGVILLGSSFFLILKRVASMDFSNRPSMLACQKAYLMTLIGLFLSICTVHIWTSTFVHVMFLIGAGVWLFTSDIDLRQPVVEEEDNGRRKGPHRRSVVKRRNSGPGADPSDPAQAEPEPVAEPERRSPYTRGPIRKK